jgi:hypothetical protein
MDNGMDAVKWNDFFYETFPNCNIDKETMLGWFANAIMAGYSKGQYESKNGLNEYANRCIDWLLSGDVGASSELIFRKMIGNNLRVGFVPNDYSDFGRCYRLLKRFPEWKDKLYIVGNESITWGRIIEKWDFLCVEYEKIDIKSRESKDNFDKILRGVCNG